MKIKFLIILTAVSILFWSCGPVYPEPGNEAEFPSPEISDVLMNYETQLELLHVECRVEFDSIPEAVLLSLTLNGGQIPIFSDTLIDAGTDGDLLAQDHLYGLTFSYSAGDRDSLYALIDCITPSQKHVMAYDTLMLIPNEAPFITLVDVPDTVVRPESGNKTVYVKVHAGDPNGIQDVVDGYFQVLSNSTGNWSADLALYDDGSNGDVLQGDGIFSRGLAISSDNSAATNYFRFRLKDSAANFSDWVSDSIVVR